MAPLLQRHARHAGAAPWPCGARSGAVRFPPARPLASCCRRHRPALTPAPPLRCSLRCCRNIKTLVLDEADEMLNKGWAGAGAGGRGGREVAPPLLAPAAGLCCRSLPLPAAALLPPCCRRRRQQGCCCVAAALRCAARRLPAVCRQNCTLQAELPRCPASDASSRTGCVDVFNNPPSPPGPAGSRSRSTTFTATCRPRRRRVPCLLLASAVCCLHALGCGGWAARGAAARAVLPARGNAPAPLPAATCAAGVLGCKLTCCVYALSPPAPPLPQVVLVSATLPHEVLEMTHKVRRCPLC